MAIPMIGDPQKTRPWKPLGGLATGAVARLTEDLRQQVWDDTVYTEEHYYGLSLRAPSGVGTTFGLQPGGAATFIFPVGPQTVRKSIEYRQAVNMTLGGIVTEERGIAWIDYTIEGNFGLGPKYGYDTTVNPAMTDDSLTPPWAAPVSGPLWTRKMFANILERYAAMKARPDENQQTVLVFHDFKNNDHFIVVPTKVELNRTVQSRMMYPFTLQLRAIARTEPTTVAKPPLTLVGLMNGLVNAARVARTAVNLATSAMDTLTNGISKIRYAAAVVDTIIDEAARTIAALNTFIDETNRLSDLSNTFAASARAVVEATMLESRTDPYFPEEQREAFQTLIDVYDMIGAQPEFQETATGEERADQFNDNQRSAETPTGEASTPGSEAAIAASGGGATKRQVVRTFGWYPYLIAEGDTLESIAVREVGNAGAWYQIAIRNALRAPYITRAGLPGTATIGDTILIPASQAKKKTASATNPESPDPVDLFGTDLKVKETGSSAPGRPSVDLIIDPKTGKDLATIAGTANLVQACQMRLWTEQGTLLLSPAYGLPSTVGHLNVNETVIALREAVKGGLRGDSRISRIQSMIVVQEDDIIDIDATVIPVASMEELSVGISVV